MTIHTFIESFLMCCLCRLCHTIFFFKYLTFYAALFFKGIFTIDYRGVRTIICLAYEVTVIVYIPYLRGKVYINNYG